MLKMLGVLGILAGIAGGLRNWWQGCQRQLEFIDEFIGLLSTGRRELTEEKRRTSEFFNEFATTSKALGETVREVTRNISQHSCRTGTEIWNQCWEKNFGREGIRKQIIVEVKKSGKAFFGKDSRENDKWFRIYENRFRDLYEREESRYKEQKRLVFPMGILSGVMLIVILV